MKRTSLYLAVLVILIGAVTLLTGGVFIFQGVTKGNLVATSMQRERVNLGIEPALVAKGEVVDSMAEAQAASDTLREHRQNISPSYNELLGGKKFDATNPTQLTWVQALNLEMYLNLAVLGFGVTQIALGVGLALIAIGIALGLIGAIQMQLARRPA